MCTIYKVKLRVCVPRCQPILVEAIACCEGQQEWVGLLEKLERAVVYCGGQQEWVGLLEDGG